jgi:nicotinamidase/pyrazinamidase
LKTFISHQTIAKIEPESSSRLKDAYCGDNLIKTRELTLTSKDALIIADIQNDFLPGGALGISDADQIIPALNEYIKNFKAASAKIIASRDWHPRKHISFKAQGGQWPSHCVKKTKGAQFSKNLKLPDDVVVVSKATKVNKEAYSIFDDTDLETQLRAWGVSKIFIGGLAADYCVLNSVVDARKLGFDVIVLVDATRGINIHLSDVDKALETMREKGALQATLEDFIEPETLQKDDKPTEIQDEKSLNRSVLKKHARMRARGSYKQIRRERG